MTRTSKLLTADYDTLSLEDRCEALRAARERASEQISDEIDQDARVGVAISRDATRIADRRVRALSPDDPRRLAYVRYLRENR